MRNIGVVVLLALLAGAPTLSRAEERRAEDRPELCPPQDWCGCWLATHLKIADQKQWRELWVARNWATYGTQADGPAPGVIAIYARGTGGHVGIVTGVKRAGFVVLKSGNDNNAVRERERSTEGVIAWRAPPGHSEIHRAEVTPEVNIVAKRSSSL